MNSIIKVSNWSDLDDLIDSLELTPTEVQLEFLYQVDSENLYWVELEITNISIEEYQNRRKTNE
jgi:hypothetical protein